MQKHEFEERIESTVSDEDYKLIEFVYQFHPVIRNVSGKDEVAELYKSFGMALFRDMEPRAKKAKEVEEKMTSCRLEIETLTELLATRKAEMKDLEAELQELRIISSGRLEIDTENLNILVDESIDVRVTYVPMGHVREMNLTFAVENPVSAS